MKFCGLRQKKDEKIEIVAFLLLSFFSLEKIGNKEKWGCFWRIGKNVLSLHIVHAEMA